MFSYRPPGTWPLVETRSGKVHVRAGENLWDGTIRLRCRREVSYQTSPQFADTRERVTCTQCLRAVDKVAEQMSHIKRDPSPIIRL